AAHQDHLELIEKRTALAQAEIAKKKIESVLSLMPAAVYTCDLAGRITYFNQRAAELWGREPKLDSEEDKYCGSFRLILPDGTSLPHDQCFTAAAVKTGESFRNQEVLVERPNGSRIAVRMNISPFHDENGRLCGLINTFQDVTQLRHAEQASLHLAALVES